MTKSILLILKGMAMGIAETIPGVSGGTLAFITGIYEQLLNSIKSFNLGLFKVWKKEGFKSVWKSIDGNFLVGLLFGMILGIGLGIVLIEWLLHHYPPVVWSFFFGLIIASIIYIARQIPKWNISIIIAFIVGAIVAFGLTQLPISDPSDNLLFVFISGAIAVSALILPGISGSFILLLMGMYTFILHDTLKNELLINHSSGALLIMIVFGLGMILGLASISRFLSWALKHYKHITFAVLAGFMLGALNKLWPWRIPEEVLNDADEIVTFTKSTVVDKVIKEKSVFPNSYEQFLDLPPFIMACIISAVGGLIIVLALDRFSHSSSK